MKTIMKASEPRLFLSAVPHLLGFTPTRSAVVIPFASGRSTGGMRVDLPPASEVDTFAATLIGMVCRVADAEAYALVVYGDEPVCAEAIPYATLAAALAARADACGLRTLDALYVGGGRWASYLASAVGGDAAELDAGPAPGAGPAPVGDQATGAALPEADPAETQSTADALRDLRRALTSLGGRHAAPGPLHPLALSATELIDDLPVFFDEVIGDGPERSPHATASAAPASVLTDAYVRATLIWCLERPALRDIGLLTWVGGIEAGDEAMAAQLRWEDGDEYSHGLASSMWGDGPCPAFDRLEAALDVCRDAAAHAPRANRPGALAACAWLAWALGRSTHADAYGRAAQEIEPAHGLAGIVLSMVRMGHVPDWAFRS